MLKILTGFIIPLALLGAAKVILMGGSVTPDGEGMGEAMANSRFGAFTGVSASLYRLLVCKYSVMGFVMSPIKTALLLSATLGIALSGFRDQMMNAAVVTVVSQWLHRQLTLFGKKLPISIETVTETEHRVDSRMLTEDELHQKALQYLKEFEESIDGVIVSRETELNVSDSKCFITASYVINCEIGKKERIYIE